MAAGDGVTADFMWELATLVMGDGTSYDVIDAQGWEQQDPKTSNLDLLGDGESGGVVRLAARDASLTVEMFHATPSSLQTLWAAFMTAWTPGAVQPFYWRLSGAKRYVNGQPWGWVPDMSQRTFGIITAVGRFRVTDPVIHT